MKIRAAGMRRVAIVAEEFVDARDSRGAISNIRKTVSKGI
jgi:hypothetical protein